MSLTIVWNKKAVNQLTKIHDYISKESPKNAQKVVKDIYVKVENIRNQPTKYALDKYKINNDGTFRYFEIYHQRVAFRITEELIKILRIRSTHQEPLEY